MVLFISSIFIVYNFRQSLIRKTIRLVKTKLFSAGIFSPVSFIQHVTLIVRVVISQHSSCQSLTKMDSDLKGFDPSRME